jgi:hypothetical protein
VLFLNEYEVANLRDRFGNHEILGAGIQTLQNLVDWTNSNSDGWAYWPKPCRAAKALQQLLQDADRDWRSAREVTVTKAQVAAALRPIKSFRTRQGADFVIVSA